MTVSLIKRFVTTVHASVDRTLAGIENHAAVVDAALKESRQAVAKARVRLARLEKDENTQRNRVAELTSEIELWNERARSVANADRDKALSCIQRRRRCEQQLHEVKAQLQQHEKVLNRVRNSIAESSNRVQTLQAQRNQMLSREAAAYAGQIVHKLDSHAGDDADAAIERWEESVVQAEVVTEHFPIPATDEFEQSFLTTEEDSLLQDELDKLINDEGSRND